MKKVICFLFFLTFLIFSSNLSNAQVVINEFMASNSGSTIDPDYNESADWIELYNPGTQSVQLNGYYITDNISDPTKWQIKVNIEIGAGKFLVIWADGMDTGLHTNFKLTAGGEELAIFSPQSVKLDSIIFGLQEPNISMGRKTDGSTEWVYFPEPTPGRTNNTINYSGIVKSIPDFSVFGGIFNKTVSLNLRTLYGGTVRYTLDGSEPNETSPIAGSSINITKNTVVRARIYKTGQVPGPVATNSYFIDLNNVLTDLPIVSISSAPENFWDSEKGIYVQDYKPEWEIPVNIELFEKDGRDKAAFNLQAGVKVNGLYSWKSPQKMLGIYFRKEYGTSKLEYPLIFDKPRKVYDTFALRASGSDWSNTLFRDGMVQNSTMDYTDLDNSGFRASVVYINGEYMGIHNIREKIDEDYIVGNHGLEGGTFDMVENENFAETGDLVAYNQMLILIAKDLTVQSNWDAVAAQVDIAGFTDLICTEVYDGNSSVDHNVMAWKPKDTGMWKWIIMDLDRGFFNINSQLINFYVNQRSWPFKDLIKNQDYKRYFGIRLANHLFTTFNQARIIPLIEKHKQTIEAEIPNHIERWKGSVSIDNYGDPISSVEYWLSEVEQMKTFAQGRPDVILNDLTNYGFQSPVPVSVTTTPAKSGLLTFNGMKIPADVCNGGYPKGEEIRLTAEAKAGYRFMGWKRNSDSLFIGREQVWKYSDNGTNQGTSWKNSDYNDSSWKSGQAELGYGDDDEKTVISYGPSSSNKYITSYFRKSFVLNNKEQVTGLTLFLKCDDGAVIYLNGNEIQRYNLPTGIIGFGTTATNSISGSDEYDFHTYSIGTEFLVNGNNVIAVEVHQNSASSSDVSFDFELSAQIIGTVQYLSTNKELVVSPQSAFNVSAVFESDGKCFIPEEITDVMTLNKACSPYVTSRDVNITSTGKLIIEPGVEIWMSDGASIYSTGTINAQGTKPEPVIFRGNPESSNKEWGFISISNVRDTSRFSNVIIEDASRGERPREVGAITAYNSVVRFDSIHFDNISANPIATRFCDVSLTNSLLHSNITGDLINVTRGKGYIANCEFIGNKMPDNDAIDFNGGVNCIVKDCIIRDYFGINSDAIDLGEKATNIRIEGLYVHDITDKGVSVGQQSKAYISNSLFTNCNLGAGIKDSSYAEIDHCTYYGVGTPVATYEKIVGRAGGNVKVTNSILSNAYSASYFCDQYSTIDISYSSSDNDKLPEGKNNLFVNPHFNNPTFFDFSLIGESSCVGAGSDGNMGSGLTDTGIEPEVMISDIAYFTETGAEDLEFVGIYNPGNSRVDMNGYKFIQGFTFTFPDGASIAPKEKIYITSNAASSFWQGRGATIYQWESGRLADEGEDIQLTNEVTTMIDEVNYNNKAPWPVPATSGEAVSLTRFDVDNHFGEYWSLKSPDEIVSSKEISKSNQLKVFPNPTLGLITVSGLSKDDENIEIYNLQGEMILELPVKSETTQIDISGIEKGLYFIRAGKKNQKIIIR